MGLLEVARGFKPLKANAANKKGLTDRQINANYGEDTIAKYEKKSTQLCDAIASTTIGNGKKSSWKIQNCTHEEYSKENFH